MLFALTAEASQLYRVRIGHYPDKIRLVLDFNGTFTYQAEKLPDRVTFRLAGTEAGPEIKNYIDTNDLVVRYLEIEKDGPDLKVNIPLAETVNYNIFTMTNPVRLVVDFDREFVNIDSRGQLSDGVEIFKVNRGCSDGQIRAAGLKVDLTKTGVEPVLAKQLKPNFLESFISLFPWGDKRQTNRHFYVDSVKNMVNDNYALAGVNGTFFAANGKPLGALLINGELISYSIYDRTAFFLDDQNAPYIDNLFITGDLYNKQGTRYQITGINENRGANDIIMYTPVWGERTQTDSRGWEIIVDNNKVAGLAACNARIPDNGFVISAAGSAVESLLASFKSGDPVRTELKIVPYSSSPSKIAHLISGGPRLVKNGLPYVSKHEERFRADISARRAARTAVGITKNKELLLVTVEPPAKKWSLGASLEELADLMISLGAVEAMNLDGGGSTSLVVGKNIAVGGQRPVSNAIIIYPKN